MENVTVNQMIELLDKKRNRTGLGGRERILGLSVNGKCYGYITSATLDGWGGGLVSDVFLQLETESDGE